METFGPNELKEDPDIEMPTFEPYGDDVDGDQPPASDADDVKVTPDAVDQYAEAELLAQGDRMTTSKVIGRKREHGGTLCGTVIREPDH